MLYLVIRFFLFDIGKIIDLIVLNVVSLFQKNLISELLQARTKIKYFQ